MQNTTNLPYLQSNILLTFAKLLVILTWLSICANFLTGFDRFVLIRNSGLMEFWVGISARLHDLLLLDILG